MTLEWVEIAIAMKQPDLAESAKTMPLQVAAVLAHELTHAAVGVDAKHGKGFAKAELNPG